jgi:UDP-N-acetylglucosamine 2-epimerase (non-hydrolysing)
MKTVLTLFGTRPEVIKLAPVVWAVQRRASRWRALNVSSSQHADLLRPMASQLAVRIDHDLAVAADARSPAGVLGSVVSALGGLLATERPDVVIVQGDTATALAGALAGFYARIPVVHVEAGLRTGDLGSPFPEELNRVLITRLADLHCAATRRNASVLAGEGVDPERILLTGNPVVEALEHVRRHAAPSPALQTLLRELDGRRILALTTHRRENFGEVMRSHLEAIGRFARAHPDVAVVFPVHPNPAVRAAAQASLGDAPGVRLVAPLGYADFVHLLSRAWLIATDSGGVQEEAPSLGKPVIILRDTTERPEVVDCGIGRLAGRDGARLSALLEEAAGDDAWVSSVRAARNPFGDGDAGERIAAGLERLLEPAGALS